MTDTESLERRVAALEAERDIREVIFRYAMTADLGLSEAFVDNFTPDAVMDVWYSKFLPVPRDPRITRGHDEIRDFITAPAQKSLEGHSHHLVAAQLVVRLTGENTAVAHGYSDMLVVDEDGVAIKSAAFREWRFERGDAGWRISYVKTRPLGSSEELREIMGVA